jgi:hypothetical protein
MVANPVLPISPTRFPTTVSPGEWRGQVVGFWGAARAGKDTASDGLGWPSVAFADELKADIEPIARRLGLDPGNPAHKEIFRPIMVAYGAAARAVDPDYWIKRLVIPSVVASLAVRDVRYLNEVKWVQGKGGLVVFINRPGYDCANEEEARSFREINAALERGEIRPIPYVLNDGTVGVLGSRVRALVREHYPMRVEEN